MIIISSLLFRIKFGIYKRQLNSILKQILDDFEHDRYYQVHEKLLELIEVTQDSDIK